MSKESDQYRFSGYQLPLISLDSTGPSYIYITPSMFNRDNFYQPNYYRKPFYSSVGNGGAKGVDYGRSGGNSS